MNPELKGVWEHMLSLGTGALAHANRHSHYADPERPWWKNMAVLQAAHAAELMIKARIAQEHPLLIFEKLPKPQPGEPGLLEIKDLFEKGFTYQWNELPSRLWATTGLRLEREDLFGSFGRLRNVIQHFTVPPSRDVSGETLDFIYKVIDPFINQCWGLCAIDYDEDDAAYEYITTAVMHRGLLFNVSPEAATCAGSWSVDWDKLDPAYRKEMERRIDAAWPESDNEQQPPPPAFLANLRASERQEWENVKAGKPRR